MSKAWLHTTPLFLLFLLLPFLAGAQGVALRPDPIPDSHISIPVSIYLMPMFAAAEKNVATVFTSPNYPKDWVQPDCATRYKYRFQRSPFQMSMKGNTLQLGFTGHYQVTGSTRACIKGTAVSPWTPACRCGFEEGKRRVQVNFTSTFQLGRDLMLRTKITNSEPRALDSCTVCFWGQDITTEIMAGLKKELELSRRAMEDSFGRLNLRPYLQKAWDRMNEVWTVPGIGYFSLHPKKLRMDQINAKNNWLDINIGITATPSITLQKPEAERSSVPDLSPAGGPTGFNINLEADLQYDSLSKIVSSYMTGKTFDVADGLFKKQVVVRSVSLAGTDQGEMQVSVDFTGSFNGILHLKGKPYYDAEKKSIEIRDLDYSLDTRNFLLKTAKWLFNQRILKELNQYTSIDLTSYYTQARENLDQWLNREWSKGIRGKGSVAELQLTSLQALPQHLLLRSQCKGNLSIQVTELSF